MCETEVKQGDRTWMQDYVGRHAQIEYVISVSGLAAVDRIAGRLRLW